MSWDAIDWTRPAWLWALALLPLAAAAALAGVRARRRGLDRFAEPDVRERTRRLPPARAAVRGALAVVALAGVALALAGPRWGSERVAVPPVRQQIVFAVDVSRSMTARDVAPSRLDRSRLAVREILAALPASEVGLVVFAGEAVLVVPLTRDAAALELFLATVDPDWISDPSTDLGRAVRVALDAFGPERSPGRAIVVLSDGEDHAGGVEAAASAAAENGVTIVSVGVGTPEGARIPVGAGWLESSGEVVVSRLETEALRDIASGTGGRFVEIGGRDGIAPAVSRLAELDTGRAEEGGTERRAERYRWPLALAVLALLGEAGLRLARRRPAAFAAVAGLLFASACGDRPDDLYREGRYREALEAWREADREPDAGPIDAYGRGSAAYRLGEAREAAAGFAVAARTADTPVREAEAWYNAGNARYRRAEEVERSDPAASLPFWDASVGAYRESLLRAPGDGDTKHNLELALRRRDQAGGGGGGGGGGGEGEGGGGGGRGLQPPSSGLGDSPREMNRSEAERLLDALASREREALAAGEGDRRGGRRQAPGW
ncbi:MAG TPA: VWA domain-containing protein [Gemmatimonadota bacterium]|nr:VWA domain-containing protein [Gemmatimonadota bacterium]